MSFLLWSLLSPVTDDSPVPWNPTDKSLLRLATDIYALLEAHFEQAPLTDDESMDWLPEIRALLPPPGPVLDIFPEMELPHDVTKFLNATKGSSLSISRIMRACAVSVSMRWSGPTKTIR